MKYLYKSPYVARPGCAWRESGVQQTTRPLGQDVITPLSEMSRLCVGRFCVAWTRAPSRQPVTAIFRAPRGVLIHVRIYRTWDLVKSQRNQRCCKCSSVKLVEHNSPLVYSKSQSGLTVSKLHVCWLAIHFTLIAFFVGCRVCVIDCTIVVLVYL